MLLVWFGVGLFILAVFLYLHLYTLDKLVFLCVLISDKTLSVCVVEQNYSESRYHFLHSSDGEGCAQMLVEYSASRGFHSEVDMFVAQAVLQ